jgi:succinyl-diaminopimelate desuccinylase
MLQGLPWIWQITAAVTGEAPRFEMCPGLLGIRFYAAQGMPAFDYGPGLLSVAHGPNEYVDLRRIVDPPPSMH